MVRTLVALVAPTQQQHQYRPLSAQVDPVPRPKIKAQLLHAIAQGLAVAKIAAPDPFQSRPDLCASLSVFQRIKPLPERRDTSLGGINPQFNLVS